MKILTRNIFFAPDDDAGGGTATAIDTSGATNLQTFNEKFSARRPGVKLPADVTLPAMIPTDAEKAADAKAREDARTESQKKIEANKQPVKGPGANVPKILEDKHAAEKERDELKAKLETFEKTDKVNLETKIADLEKKLAEGGNTKEETVALKKKLEETEGKLAERETTLVNEKERLQKKLSFYDAQEDPDFIAKYVVPVTEAYNDAINTFAGDEQKILQLRRALMANSQSLSSTKPEDRVLAEKERNTILSQIKESMDDFSAGQFITAMNQYIRTTVTHAKALQNHEQTTTELKKKRDEMAMTERTRIFDTWNKQFDYTSPTFDEQAKVDDDLKDTLKELKLDPDSEVQELTKVAKRVMIGKATPEESIDLIHKGRIQPALTAKIKALEKVNADLRSTVEKLKGAGTGGGGTGGAGQGGGSGGGSGASEPEKKTLQDKNKKFAASRFGGNLPIARSGE